MHGLGCVVCDAPLGLVYRLHGVGGFRPCPRNKVPSGWPLAFHPKKKSRTLAPQSNSRPSAKKSLGSLFGLNTNLYVVSSLCNRLNQHLPADRKLDPSVPRLTLLSTIQTMADVGLLPNDKTMEEVLSDQHFYDDVEGDLV